jgi:hypothetical protein
MRRGEGARGDAGAGGEAFVFAVAGRLTVPLGEVDGVCIAVSQDEPGH